MNEVYHPMFDGPAEPIGLSMPDETANKDMRSCDHCRESFHWELGEWQNGSYVCPDCKKACEAIEREVIL